MEGAPEISSYPELPNDLDRIRDRLELERFQPTECFDGRVLEIESVDYPDWYNSGRLLLEVLGGRRVTNEELKAIAEEIGIDLKLVLGIKDSGSTGSTMPEGTTWSPRQERGRG